jgi:gluconate kinase
MCCQGRITYHLKARNAVYSSNKAKSILLQTSSTERARKQSLHSDDTNKLVYISKRETTVRNRYHNHVMCHRKSSFFSYNTEEAQLHLLHNCGRDTGISMGTQYVSGTRHSAMCYVYDMTSSAWHSILKGY